VQAGRPPRRREALRLRGNYHYTQGEQVTKADLQKSVLDAAASGSFVTPKHDPANIATPLTGDRSVFTVPASSSLCEMFRSGTFTVEEYKKSTQKDPLYVVTPFDPKMYPVADMLLSGSTTPTSQCDRILVYSGSVQGWHGCGESMAVIDAYVSSSAWTFVGPVT